MKRYLILAGLLIVILAVAGFYSFDPDQRLHGWVMGEPFYQGRSATAWEIDAGSEDANLLRGNSGQTRSGQHGCRTRARVPDPFRKLQIP